MYLEERFKNKTLFREITGVKFETYLKIVSDYKNYKLSTIKTGRPLRIPIEDRVLILLLYFKQYFSMSYVAYQYKTSKSCIYYIISDILKFLKSRYEITNNEIKDAIIIVDATEVKIERPKYNYNFYYLEID